MRGALLTMIGGLGRRLNHAGITKFEDERKNEKNSGSSSKMTSSCKWQNGGTGNKIVKRNRTKIQLLKNSSFVLPDTCTKPD